MLVISFCFIWEECFLQKGSYKVQRALQQLPVFSESVKMGEIQEKSGQTRSIAQVIFRKQQQNAKVTTEFVWWIATPSPFLEKCDLLLQTHFFPAINALNTVWPAELREG
jgi:hypothetical protein